MISFLQERKNYDDVRLVQHCWPSRLPSVQWHFNRWNNCNDCELGRHSYRKVFYRGYAPADILYVGEAPDRREDAAGFPALGESGSLLDAIIDETSIRLDPSSRSGYICYRWAITNSVLCVPKDTTKASGVRQPSKLETDACSKRLYHFVSICSPSVIVCCGDVARRAVLSAIPGTIHFTPESSIEGVYTDEPFRPLIITIPSMAQLLKQKHKLLEVKKAVLHIVESVKPLFPAP